MKDISQLLATPSNRPFIYVLLVIDLVVRGFALYKSARKDQKIWFIALLLVNSLGLLPLVYLFMNRQSAIKPVSPARSVRKQKRPKKKTRK